MVRRANQADLDWWQWRGTHSLRRVVSIKQALVQWAGHKGENAQMWVRIKQLEECVVAGTMRP